ncbi:MAG: uroporphyrinogen decarboxylase [Flavobacteriales bacterium]
MPLQNDLILRAARGETVSRIPVWLMRQAGRILPEYRKVRAGVKGFRELVQSPVLASEVTVQPVELLGVDAAIIFSDIMVLPEAMGLPYKMIENKGADELSYVLDAISLAKKALHNRVPLIGFAGAPWTIFAYMTEGSGSKVFSKSRRLLYSDSQSAHLLLDKITESTINYLKAQVEAGADILQLFDSWAGILPPQQYSEFAIKYIGRICDAIDNVPIIVFAKGAYFALSELAALSCQVIGLDWNMNIATTKEIVGPGKTLQGNADPCLLYAGEEEIIEKTKIMLRNFGHKNYIANLGHGLYPDTDPEKVKLFINTVKQF